MNNNTNDNGSEREREKKKKKKNSLASCLILLHHIIKSSIYNILINNINHSMYIFISYCPMYPLVTPTSKINAGTPNIPTMPIIAIGSFKGFSPLFSAGDKNASVSASFFRVSLGSSPLFSALTTVETFSLCCLLKKEVVR